MWASFWKSSSDVPSEVESVESGSEELAIVIEKTIKCVVNDGITTTESACSIEGGYFAIHKWVCAQICTDGDDPLHYIPMKLPSGVIWFNIMTNNRTRAVYMGFDEQTGTFADYVQVEKTKRPQRSKRSRKAIE